LVIVVMIWVLWKLHVRTAERRFTSINNGRSLPGPNPSFLGLVELWVFLKGSYLGLLEKYGHYGPVIRVYVGPFVWVIPTCLNTVNHLFSKKAFQRGLLSKAFGDITPNTIIISDGLEWRRHRTAISPFFSEEEVEKFSSNILEIAKEEFDDLDTDKSFELTLWTNMIVGRVFMKSLFNVSVNKKNADELKKFNAALHVLGDWVGLVFVCGTICPSIMRTQFMKNYIQKKTAPFKNLLKDMKKNPNPDSLWQQLAHHGKFTWEEFENESIGLLVAGLETSSYALTWILYYLTKNPECKSKLKHEIDSVLDGKLPTIHDLKNLPYLEKVIFETLRIDAIVLALSRTAVEQDSIGDYQIPIGTSIFDCINYTVRHSVENPDIFNPDRFTNENMRELSKNAMAAFGVGTHQCIGKHLALLQLKLILCIIFQNGDIEVDTTKTYFNPHFPMKVPRLLTAIKKPKMKSF